MAQFGHRMREFDNPDKSRRQQSSDLYEVNARVRLKRFFEENNASVFFSRQLEVQNEDKCYHWITNRAIHYLEAEGVIRYRKCTLSTGTSMTLLWHKGYRYHQRSAKLLTNLVEEYSTPAMGEALGERSELLVLEAFARNQFVMYGRNVRKYSGRIWTETRQDLDFIFARDGIVYGVEVKNALPYMDIGELKDKIRLCQHLGIRPLFVVRMMPTDWINEIYKLGGFTLVLKYQLYPLIQGGLAKRVANELGLPVDTPKRIEDETMRRFLRWHEKSVNLEMNSQ